MDVRCIYNGYLDIDSLKSDDGFDGILLIIFEKDKQCVVKATGEKAKEIRKILDN